MSGITVVNPRAGLNNAKTGSMGRSTSLGWISNSSRRVESCA